jgi:hypothetical protein
MPGQDEQETAAMPYTDTEARELGEHRGYQAADYAANVAGEPVRQPVRADEPAMSDDAWLYFADGWASGIEAFERATTPCAICGKPLGTGRHMCGLSNLPLDTV